MWNWNLYQNLTSSSWHNPLEISTSDIVLCPAQKKQGLLFPWSWLVSYTKNLLWEWSEPENLSDSWKQPVRVSVYYNIFQLCNWPAGPRWCDRRIHRQTCRALKPEFFRRNRGVNPCPNYKMAGVSGFCAPPKLDEKWIWSHGIIVNHM